MEARTSLGNVREVSTRCGTGRNAARRDGVSQGCQSTTAASGSVCGAPSLTRSGLLSWRKGENHAADDVALCLCGGITSRTYSPAG
jgi:hypothetical protein